MTENDYNLGASNNLRESSHGINWLLLGFVSLALMPLPYLPIIAVRLPLVMSPDSWMKSSVLLGPFVMYWLLLLSGILFLMAGFKQDKVYFWLSGTCLVIFGLMSIYALLVGMI